MFAINKKLAGIVSITFLMAAAAHAVELSDIARDSGGNVLYMNQYQAAKYCQDRGLRLPTARELAEWSMRFGGEISDKPQRLFSEVNTSTPEGQPDKFYVLPGASGGRYMFWSSSEDPKYSEDPKNPDFFYALFSDGSGLSSTFGGNCFGSFETARCVLSR